MYVINETNQNLKQDKIVFMDNENHKNTWNNLQSLFCGNCRCCMCFGINGNILVEFLNEGGSILENQNLEKNGYNARFS